MFLPVFKYIRYKTPKSRIFLFNSGNAAAILRLIGSEEVGGLGDIRAKAQAVARITGEDVDEVAKKVVHPHILSFTFIAHISSDVPPCVWGSPQFSRIATNL